MKTLRECIKEAQEKGVAIGHFNFSTLDVLWAIFRAAKENGVPVIAGVSEGERDFVGVRQAVALVKSIREEFDYPIFLNADHTYSVERAKEAILAGFDSVIFDGTELSFEDNVKATKEVVAYARAAGRDVIVEGELGFIGKSSKVLAEIPAGVKISEEFLTKPGEAKKFVEATGVDLLAPAVGNIHGMLKGGIDPALHIDVVKAVRDACGVPLVLHGGSGNSAEDFSAAIAAGVAIIHINTEIRVAYCTALKLSLQENPEEMTPYKFLKPALLKAEKVVLEKLKIFNKLV